jgi:hypothetical protein
MPAQNCCDVEMGMRFSDLPVSYNLDDIYPNAHAYLYAYHSSHCSGYAIIIYTSAPYLYSLGVRVVVSLDKLLHSIDREWCYSPESALCL